MLSNPENRISGFINSNTRRRWWTISSLFEILLQKIAYLVGLMTVKITLIVFFSNQHNTLLLKLIKQGFLYFDYLSDRKWLVHLVLYYFSYGCLPVCFHTKCVSLHQGFCFGMCFVPLSWVQELCILLRLNP